MAEDITFEVALQRLEQIVESLEQGQLTLEESIRKFEEGVALAGRCSQLLKAAERKVQQLTKRAEGSFDLEAWDSGRAESGKGEES